MKMRAIFLGLAVCFLLTVSIASAADKSCDELIQRSEQAWMQNKFDDSDKLLDEAMKICPNRAALYWRKARNEYERIEAIPRDKKPDKDTLIARYNGIIALGDKCIELDEKDGNCWHWKGVGIGRRGSTKGVLASLGDAEELEEIWLNAESLKPQYRAKNGAGNTLGDSCTALGQFYRLVPEWLCYFPLKQLIGTCGSVEKSVEYQRKAVAREPKRIEYQKELAVSLLCHGQKENKPEEIEEAKKILKDLQSLPEIKPSDKIDKEHAKMLLEDPSLACGYSRDAQQEQSKEAYEKDK